MGLDGPPPSAAPSVPLANATLLPDQPAVDLDWISAVGSVALRPFISDLSVTNDGVTYVAWEAGTSPFDSPVDAVSADLLFATITPKTKCPDGETWGCDGVPNRIGIDFGYTTGEGYMETNFSNTDLPFALTDTSVIDLTVRMNSVSHMSFEFSRLRGELFEWDLWTTESGNTSLRVQMGFAGATADCDLVFGEL
jgi:hypothetical protein